MVLPLALIASLAWAECPKDDSPAAFESATQGPLEVCNAIADAAKSKNMEVVLSHSTAFVRSHFGRKEKFALEMMHGLLVGIRCVKVSHRDDVSTPARAFIWVYAPQGKSREVPFVREHDFWRFDFQEYQLLQSQARR